jgi:hypothetical protein
MRAVRSLLLLPLLFVLASSCASIPRAKPEEDAQAKTFATHPDSCGLYVYRNEGYYPTSELDLELDGEDIGATGARTFRLVWLTPGPHTLLTRCDDTEGSELRIDAKPGTLLYVWQEAKMGTWMLLSVFHVVNEEKGQQGVRECELLAEQP